MPTPRTRTHRWIPLLIAATGLACDRYSGLSVPNNPSLSAGASLVRALNVSAGDTTTALPVGQTVQLRAIAKMLDGSIQDISGLAVWATDNASVASVTATGLVGAVGPGTTNITARYQEATGLFVIDVSELKSPPATDASPVTPAPDTPAMTPAPDAPTPPDSSPAPPCSSDLPLTPPSPLSPCLTLPKPPQT